MTYRSHDLCVPRLGAPGLGVPGLGAPGLSAPGLGAPGLGVPGLGAPGLGAPGLIPGLLNSWSSYQELHLQRISKCLQDRLCGL